jgi:hypothetical protein
VLTSTTRRNQVKVYSASKQDWVRVRALRSRWELVLCQDPIKDLVKDLRGRKLRNLQLLKWWQEEVYNKLKCCLMLQDCLVVVRSLQTFSVATKAINLSISSVATLSITPCWQTSTILDLSSLVLVLRIRTLCCQLPHLNLLQLRSTLRRTFFLSFRRWLAAIVNTSNNHPVSYNNNRSKRRRSLRLWLRSASLTNVVRMLLKVATPRKVEVLARRVLSKTLLSTMRLKSQLRRLSLRTYSTSQTSLTMARSSSIATNLMTMMPLTNEEYDFTL